MALDPEIDAAIEVQGTADLDAGCAIASNSHSDSSVEIWGNAWVNSTPISAVGDIAIGGNADVDTNTYDLDSADDDDELDLLLGDQAELRVDAESGGIEQLL